MARVKEQYYWSEDTINTLREELDCEVGLTIDVVEDVNQWIEDKISSEFP